MKLNLPKNKILTDEDEMPFGKYAGIPMERVPSKYLDYLMDIERLSWLKQNYPEVLAYIEKNEDLIEEDLETRVGEGEYLEDDMPDGMDHWVARCQLDRERNES